jgi:hypothetical protein
MDTFCYGASHKFNAYISSNRVMMNFSAWCSFNRFPRRPLHRWPDEYFSRYSEPRQEWLLVVWSMARRGSTRSHYVRSMRQHSVAGKIRRHYRKLRRLYEHLRGRSVRTKYVLVYIFDFNRSNWYNIYSRLLWSSRCNYQNRNVYPDSPYTIWERQVGQNRSQALPVEGRSKIVATG